MKPVKVLFIMSKSGTMENFSIPILSALVKKEGHISKLAAVNSDFNTLYKKVREYKPDIIAYSLCSNEAKEYLFINQLLKKEFSFFSIFGGPHPTFFPTFIYNEGIDAICRGESDLTLPKLLNEFGNESMYNTNNFSFKVNGKIIENPVTDLVSDLDSLPFPDRDILYESNYFMAKNPVKTFMASRGCPFDCSYCFNHIYNAMYKNKGKIMRDKSVSFFINEINDIKKRYPLTFIKFHDDLFGANRQWLTEFSERYPKEVGIPFLALSRPNLINDDYCSLLKKSGCNSVEMAVECGNENIRNNILKRNVKNSQIVSACKSLKKFSIRIYTLNMVGLPTETIEDMLSTIRINQETKVDFTDTSIFQPYPGTELSMYCVENGILNKDMEAFQSQFSTSVLNYSKDLKNKIYVLHRLFAVIVDYPALLKTLPLLFLLNKLSLVKYLYNIVYRFYYGFFLHRRIFASKIPFKLFIYGGLKTIFSKNRV